MARVAPPERADEQEVTEETEKANSFFSVTSVPSCKIPDSSRCEKNILTLWNVAICRRWAGSIFGDKIITPCGGMV
jgi:hypothetical protein